MPSYVRWLSLGQEVTEECNIRTTLTSDAKLTSAIKCHVQRQQTVSDPRERSTGHITRLSGPEHWLQGAGHPNMPKAIMKKKSGASFQVSI